MSDKLRRIAPVLRQKHIDVVFGPRGRTGTLILIDRAGETPSPSSPSSPNPTGAIEKAVSPVLAVTVGDGRRASGDGRPTQDTHTKNPLLDNKNAVGDGGVGCDGPEPACSKPKQKMVEVRL
jgi:hypothetical protein